MIDIDNPFARSPCSPGPGTPPWPGPLPVRIGLAGRAFAGKDAVAAVLGTDHGMHRVAFGDAIKTVARDLYDLSEDQVHDPIGKETPDPRWPTPVFPGGVTPRFLLQRLGTEVGRQVHPETWVVALERAIARAERGHPRDEAGRPWRWVIPDVRMENEALSVRRAGGIVIRVTRPRGPCTPGSAHATEAGADGIAADLEIINDGTLDDLRRAVRAWFPAPGLGR